MRKFFKTLFLWLVILAIPVQGFAASGALPCASHHKSDMSNSAVHTAQQDLTAHDCDEHQHMTSMNDDVTHHAHAVQSDQSAEHKSFTSSKCNACASSCFHAAFLPSAELQFASNIPHFIPFAYATADRLAVRAHRLERPPRSILLSSNS